LLPGDDHRLGFATQNERFGVFGKYNQSFSLKSVPQQHCAVARPIEIELLWRAGGLHALILASNLGTKKRSGGNMYMEPVRFARLRRSWACIGGWCGKRWPVRFRRSANWRCGISRG
jgi:hypothetical protein